MDCGLSKFHCKKVSNTPSHTLGISVSLSFSCVAMGRFPDLGHSITIFTSHLELQKGSGKSVLNLCFFCMDFQQVIYYMVHETATSDNFYILSHMSQGTNVIWGSIITDHDTPFYHKITCSSGTMFGSLELTTSQKCSAGKAYPTFTR